MPTPPGVSEQDFSAALQEFENVVGRDWVFASDEDAALYRDAYSVLRGEDDDYWASGAVAPTTVEQVQAIVRIANKYQIPIYPISTGKNYGLGGSAPNHSGSFCVDLKRMNRILEVDERSATALVEPGVTYFDLYRHIQENNLKVWIDCPDPGWGSVLGNAVDHGQGHTGADYRDHFDAHCGMEVVLPDGELLRTGMGAMPNSPIWQRYKYGLGPSLDGLFNQSNMGIVTKMGFFLMPQPEACMDFYVDVPRYDDIVPLVDIHAYLQNCNMATGKGYLLSPVMRRPFAFTRFMPDVSDPELDRIMANGPDPKQLEDWALKNNIPCWRFRMIFYGPEKVIDAQWEYARDLYTSAIPGVQFHELSRLVFPITEHQVEEFEFDTLGGKVELGMPSLDVFAYGIRRPDNPDPAYGEVWVAPKIPKTGEAVLKAHEVFGKVFRDHNYPLNGYDTLPQAFSKRCYDMIYLMVISDDRERNRHTREVYQALMDAAAEHGWADYRLPLAFQEHAMSLMSFGNHSHRRTLERIKDALDPNGIMANGRYGIWPEHLRGEKA